MLIINVLLSSLCSTLILLLDECYQSSPLLLHSVWLCETRREAGVCMNANCVAHWVISKELELVLFW